MTTREGRRSLGWLPVVGVVLGCGFALMLTLAEVVLFAEGFRSAARGYVLSAVAFAVVWSVSSGFGEVRARRRSRPPTT